MARPGVMLYFELLEPIRVLPDADRGRLLTAILEYGRDGVEPEFQGMLALAWGFVRPKIDRDREEYEKTVQRRQYATFCRERKRRGESEVAFEDWARDQVVSGDAASYPTTAAIPSPNTSKTISTAAVTEAAASAADRKLKRLHGELGQGVVNLSEYQIDRLLNLMGVEMFDHYVRRLSDFILREGASVKNHYQTIQKWWAEDSAC